MSFKIISARIFYGNEGYNMFGYCLIPILLCFFAGISRCMCHFIFIIACFECQKSTPAAPALHSSFIMLLEMRSDFGDSIRLLLIVVSIVYMKATVVNTAQSFKTTGLFMTICRVYMCPLTSLTTTVGSPNGFGVSLVVDGLRVLLGVGGCITCWKFTLTFSRF
jgi:hypothetical protein